jgi:hypothetical protein
MQAKLTNQTIRPLRLAEKPYEIVDADIKGFLLRVQPSGVMTYYFSYRNEQGKRARYRIGKHGSITPAQARDEALGLSARVIAGEDIQALKKQERAAAEAAKSQTLSGFLEHRYGPWVLTQRKTGDATLKRIQSTFAHLLDRPLNGLDPFSWTPEPYTRRNPRCQKQESPIPPNFASRWSSSSGLVERPRSYRGSLSQRLSRSATGSLRLTATKANARAA